MSTKSWMTSLIGVAAVVVLVVATQYVFAQPAQTQPSSNQSSPQGRQPESNQIEQQLLNELNKQRIANTDTNPRGSDTPPDISTPDVDHGVLGVAPGEQPPKLRREGEFIINRRGRVMQSPNGRHLLFVFEADSQAANEPPMILSPCQMLQNIEDIIHERGDEVVFILSGQILVYHGLNYMLPTMMKLAIDHGNLEN